MDKKPSIFVMVDMEGISGITQSLQVMPGQAGYTAGQRYMNWDVNACIDGCFRGGAGRVVVRDAHYRGFNLLWEQIDPRAELVQGSSGRQRMTNIESFDGLILLGYHAMHGTPEAILEHTWAPEAWQNLWMNGQEVGEIALDAGIAGDNGVPVLMVSGDDKACAEAKRFLPHAATAVVKYGASLHGGRLLGKETAHQLIRDTAAQAVQSYQQAKPYKVSSPVTLRLELVSRGQVPARRPDVKVIDGRTYEVTRETVEAALYSL